MKLYNNKVVRIQSALTDLAVYAKRLATNGDPVHGHSAVLLYFFCRGLDTEFDGEGQSERKADGKVVFNISDAARCLDKTIATIKDYLVNGAKLGLFRSYERVGNTVTVYYASLHNVAARYGIDRLGVFADIPMAELKHLKYWGTQLTAQHLQGASRHLAKKKLPRNERVAQPEDILQSPIYIKNHPKSKSPKVAKPIKKQDKVASSEQEQNQWARNVVYRSDRYTFVDSHFIMFGVSQQHVADYQGRHISTIHRRLNNNARHWIGNDRIGTKRERGIEPLPQTQLAGFVQGNVKKEYFHELVDLVVDLEQVFWAAGGIWRSGPNIYERQFQITSGKSSKYWYKKKLETGKLKLGLADDVNTDGVGECDRSNPVDINTGSISIHPALQPNTN